MELGMFRLNIYQPGGPIGALYPVEKILYHGRSQYQEIMILVLRGFGKTLVLDGLIQSTESDEHIYHETLVHPAMTVHPNPRRVLILGGGEGATLREVLKHNTVEKAVMVDIDGEVVRVAREYLPEWHQGAFDDPRAQVVIMDGFEYIKEAARRGEDFDVIIMDLTDPFGPKIAAKLYTKEAIGLVKSVLRSDGILVTQAGCAALFPEAFEKVYGSVKSLFAHAEEYGVWVPSFMYVNSFVFASDKYRLTDLSMEEVDRRLRERGVETRFYSGLRHYTLIGLGGIRLLEGRGS
ncbi:polyamine aminopropyltransferase [Hyperthermus butylicus]|uniref:Polyamine aminopropyltransferase 1 n=1 Tax=Hyperthermus butylicus (strain DSM 5456 / JCM 9403 / PLM1-5) TaxID=415426 RepID=SPEE1_HYPBU|nr:polyamine aminopropyltransferase [Hyperthermus butylicus]A2BIX4.1 RecName: Full=Polyamine aminopropyltransferase 1; AltName: Full=Caldopentamine synthase; AltName: Full=Norspermidine aminopropyltransferase; AltName: Full=Norspermine aminopropyltransferase; AltName: Full=Norspermine synthase; AltName: Full=Spermidine aminopropyltransferase; AltName: Full=Thermospermine synthase; AltName: Full=Triamine/tetramine aminopropyltransferase [Hyperthermus butylicus DSM 5456]ABM79935.1 Spermidine syntha